MNKYHLILISMLLFNSMLMADETTVAEAEDVPEIIPVSLSDLASNKAAVMASPLGM